LLWAVMLGCGALGCGSDEESVANFEGLWTAQRSSGSSSCSGPYPNMEAYPFTMRLRAGSSSDLEYVTLDNADLTKETCVQTFSVDGDTATMEGAQDCTQTVQETDPVSGELLFTTIELVTTYTRDKLVVDGDALHESVSWKVPSAPECTDSFEIDFKRL
jgi:hypothetical protein